MDIFEFAIEKEKYAESFYKELAEKTDNQGLKHILNLLASEENKHRLIVEDLRNKTPLVPKSDLIGNAKDIFKKMKDGKEKIDLNVNHIQLYEKALEFEKKSFEFYTEKAGEIKDEQRKNILLILANEEKKHILLIEKIIQFLIRPKLWLENAEFVHLDDF